MPAVRPAHVATAQGAYFLLTGVWPIVHKPSFLFVTGPKHDLWLLDTVGVLVAAIGLALLVAARRDEVTVPVRVLAVASALGLAAIDVVFVATGTLRWVYLLDAAAEALLLAAWAWVSRPSR